MTPEQEQAEREHCECVLRDTEHWDEDETVVAVLLRERAAAYQAGFDFGFEVGRKAGGK